MNIDFLLTALLAVSIFTNLTVEAIKKILNKEGSAAYSSNLLAAVVAVILSVASTVGYIIWTSQPVTSQVVLQIILLSYLSFLSSTLGYDKVMQAAKQLNVIK